MSTQATNAVLRAINGPSTPDRYGDTGTGDPVWEGEARGYLKRSRRTVISGGAEMPVRRDVLTVLNTQGAPVLELAGADWEASTVTVEDQRTADPVTRVFRVVAMENRAAGTIADSVRLELGEEATA